MKRLYMAAALLAVCIALCVCEMQTVNTKAQTYTENLTRINEMMKAGEYEKAAGLATDTLSSWKKSATKLDKYLYHDYVDSITASMSALPIYAKSQSVESVQTAVENIKIQLTSLKESELPYVHNIL